MRRVTRDRFVHFGSTPMSAFSLIELLVVVGILSILLAVAMPSWQSVRVASAVREARIVLERLSLHQRHFWQQHTRYAATDEVTAISGAIRDRRPLLPTECRVYQCRVSAAPREYCVYCALARAGSSWCVDYN